MHHLTRTFIRAAAALLLAAGIAGPARAADKYFAFNGTTATTFTGLYLAPSGTTTWGKNETLNDKDKSLENGERLRLTGLKPGTFDVKLVDDKGHTCIKKGVDMTHDHSFEIRDSDIAACH